MYLINSLYLFISLFSFFPVCENAEVTDYLNIPGPIHFDNTSYSLAWSNHPTTSYFKQEYIPKKDKLSKFNKMVLIDVILSDTLKLETIVSLKIIELLERQKRDATVNYQVINNEEKSRYIVDFIVSEGTSDVIHIMEWNAYSYCQFTDPSGRRGIMLFGVSSRSYDEKIADLFESLPKTRTRVLRELMRLDTPKVELQNESRTK